MYEGKQACEPYVGMGATEMCYTDRQAYTVQKVISEKRVVVTRDKVRRVDDNGASDAQAYEYESTPLVEEKPELKCTNMYVSMGLVCKAKTEDENACESCSFYKKCKSTNGVVLAKCKKGWKVLGGDTYFYLGEREEYYDYGF